MAAEHPAVIDARAGKMTPAAVSAYISSLHQLILHSVPHCQLAMQEAKRRRLDGLADYFQSKIREEKGHERWAEADLRRLVKVFGVEPDVPPLPATRGLVAYLRALIYADPRMYLAYVVTNECFTVTAGPVWLSALCEGSGIPRKALTVVERHVAIDVHHSADAFKALDDHLEPRLVPAALEAVDNTARRYSHFFDEVRAVALASPQNLSKMRHAS